MKAKKPLTWIQKHRAWLQRKRRLASRAKLLRLTRHCDCGHDHDDLSDTLSLGSLWDLECERDDPASPVEKLQAAENGYWPFVILRPGVGPADFSPWLSEKMPLTFFRWMRSFLGHACKKNASLKVIVGAHVWTHLTVTKRFRCWPRWLFS